MERGGEPRSEDDSQASTVTLNSNTARIYTELCGHQYIGPCLWSGGFIRTCFTWREMMVDCGCIQGKLKFYIEQGHQLWQERKFCLFVL